MAVCYSNALKIIEMQTQEKKERFQLGEISLKDYENHLCYLDDQLSNLAKGQEALLKSLGGIHDLVNSYANG